MINLLDRFELMGSEWTAAKSLHFQSSDATRLYRSSDYPDWAIVAYTDEGAPIANRYRAQLSLAELDPNEGKIVAGEGEPKDTVILITTGATPTGALGNLYRLIDRFPWR